MQKHLNLIKRDIFPLCAKIDGPVAWMQQCFFLIFHFSSLNSPKLPPSQFPILEQKSQKIFMVTNENATWLYSQNDYYMKVVLRNYDFRSQPNNTQDIIVLIFP